MPATQEPSRVGFLVVNHHPLEKNQGAWSDLRLDARKRNSAGEEFPCYTNPIWVRTTSE